MRSKLGQPASALGHSSICPNQQPECQRNNWEGDTGRRQPTCIGGRFPVFGLQALQHVAAASLQRPLTLHIRTGHWMSRADNAMDRLWSPGSIWSRTSLLLRANPLRLRRRRHCRLPRRQDRPRLHHHRSWPCFACPPAWTRPHRACNSRNKVSLRLAGEFRAYSTAASSANPTAPNAKS